MSQFAHQLGGDKAGVHCTGGCADELSWHGKYLAQGQADHSGTQQLRMSVDRRACVGGELLEVGVQEDFPHGFSPLPAL